MAEKTEHNKRHLSRIEEIFNKVIDQSVEDTRKLLDELCGTDIMLRSDVQRLLSEGNQCLDGFMQVPTSALADDTCLDDYRIIKRIGEGGMGSVFLAEQANPRRKVALKTLKSGFASSDDRKRFEYETQVLGQLKHPGIAQIYDAGSSIVRSSAGLEFDQPYFVMELVEGQPLTEYASSKDLNTAQKLRLVADVCDAMESAHQRGVVHRDLKPTNVLVDADGQPKILDFGVARATSPELQIASLHTEAGSLIGTLPYMSPEQVVGKVSDIDRRSDVYALGVILYELLAGKLPYDLSECSIASAAEVIAESDPIPLSVINKRLRGDLNTIVFKSLEKLPERRYQTAADFANDIRRFLADEPISARAPTTWYQARKFASRHRALVGGVAAVFAVMLAGILTTSWQARNAILERDRTAEQALRATEAAGLITRAIAAATPEEASGDEPTIRELLDEISHELRTDESIHRVVAADTHRTLSLAYRTLGQFAESKFHAEHAIDLHTELNGPNSINVLEDKSSLATTLAKNGEDDDAIRIARGGLQLGRDILDPDDPLLIILLNTNAVVLSESPDPDRQEIEQLFREAYEKSIVKFGDLHDKTLRFAANLGGALIELGQFEESKQLLQMVHDLHYDQDGPGHPKTLAAVFNLSVLLTRKGDSVGALELSKPLVILAAKAFGEDHPRVLRYRDYLSELHFTLGEHEQAAELARETLDISHKRLGSTHKHTLEARGLLTMALIAMGKKAEAEPLALEQYEQCLEEFGQLHHHTVQAVTLLFDLAEAKGDIEEMRRWAEALKGSQWEKPAMEMVRQMEEKATLESDN